MLLLRFVAKVDFPTPPFALEIAIVNFVPLIGFLVKAFLGPSFSFHCGTKFRPYFQSLFKVSLPCFCPH